MKAPPTAGTFAVIATALVAITPQTYAQLSPQSGSDPNAASGSYQQQDSGVIDSFAEVDAKSGPPSCQLKRRAMNDTAASTAFAATAAQDGSVEVALAGLALQKSGNDQVRQFAERVVEDYAQSNGDLYSIVKCEGLVLPTGLDAKHNAMLRSLNAKSGSAFDKAYLKHVARRNSEAVGLFETASRSGDPDLAAYARKGLSTLQEHQLLADNLRGGNPEVASTH